MRALRVLRRRPGLAIAAGINISLLIALSGASAQIAGDLLGWNVSSGSRKGFQLDARDGPDRQRFSSGEFELISSFATADRVVGASGGNVVIMQPATGPAEEIEVCYLSKGLRENLRLSASNGVLVDLSAALERPRTAVMSERLWRRWTGAPNLGQERILNTSGPQVEVAAVAGLHGMSTWGCVGDVLLRLEDLADFSQGTDSTRDENAWWLSVFLLSSRHSSDHAWISAVAPRFAQAFDLFEDERLTLVPGYWVALASLRPLAVPLALLLGAVTLLVVLGIVNCSLLVVALTRSRAVEIATKQALGAGLFRLTASELAPVAGLTLSALAAGALASGTVLDYAKSSLGPRMEGQVADSVGLAPLALPGALVLGVVFLASVAPFLGLARSENVIGRLSRAGIRIAPGVGGRLLGAAEAATCVVITGVGVVIALTATNVLDVNPNLDVERVVFVSRLSARSADGLRPEPGVLRERLSSLAGVRCVSHLTVVPLSGFLNAAPVAGRNGRITAQFNEVGANVLCAIGTALLSGRDFLPADELEERKVALVSRSAAAALFGGAAAVGSTVTVGMDGIPHTVVGVFEDPKFNTLREAETLHVWVPASLDRRKTLVLHSGDLLGRDVARSAFRLAPTHRIETLGNVVFRSQASLVSLAGTMKLVSAIVLLTTLIALYAWISAELERRRSAAALLSALGAGPTRVAASIGVKFFESIGLGAILGVAAVVVMLRVVPVLVFGIDSPTAVATLVGCLEVVAVFVVSAPAIFKMLRPDYRLLTRTAQE